MGSDFDDYQVRFEKEVSIHAPTWGATAVAVCPL